MKREKKKHRVLTRFKFYKIESEKGKISLSRHIFSLYSQWVAFSFCAWKPIKERRRLYFFFPHLRPHLHFLSSSGKQRKLVGEKELLYTIISHALPTKAPRKSSSSAGKAKKFRREKEVKGKRRKRGYKPKKERFLVHIQEKTFSFFIL